MSNGTEIAAEVLAALIEAGEATGDGALMCTISRTTGADETTYPPTPGTTASYTSTAIINQYSARDRDGTQITSRDVQVMISVPIANVSDPDDTIDLSNGDTLTVAGRTYAVIAANPVNPGGTVLFYEAQCRSADT